MPQARDKKQSQNASTWKVLSPVLCKYMGPELYLIIPAVLAGALAASAGFGLPATINVAFPIVFGEQELPPEVQDWVVRTFAPADMEAAKLWLAVALIPLVMIVRGVGTYLNSYLLACAGTHILQRLWGEVFARLQQLSFSFFDRHRRGELMTIVIQFAHNLQGQMVTVMNDLIIQPLTFLFAAGYLVYAALTSNESAMLLGNLLAAAMVVPIVRYVGRRMVRRMRQSLSGTQQITATVEESLSAQREVRSFNLQKHQSDLLAKQMTQFNSLIIRMSAWQLSLAPAVEIVSSFALAYSLYRGCGDGLTMEQFAAIATAFYYCYDPLKRLAAVLNQTQLMSIMVSALDQILKAKDETPEPEKPKSLPSPVRGKVDFNKVCFSYRRGEPVLRGVDVHIPSGQIVALVGPSGSGKTTFINLICRFYDVDSGSVCIDDVDVRELSRTERMANIAIVSQFSALFHDSIMENIRAGYPAATDEEVVAAGDSARVTEFAMEKPGGYRYELGESGGGLSGGQRQRVSIARAFLKNAPILILDEATSALDMKSEALIQESLEQLARGHTTFIIAHRFSTIRMAQRILVFEAGRIIADGTHTELYESCNVYRSLYDEQVRLAETDGKEETPS